MKRLLWLVAGLLTFGAAWYFRCQHLNARRQPLGGYRCEACGEAFADLPTLDHAFVHPLRTTVERDPLAVIRKAGW